MRKIVLTFALLIGAMNLSAQNFFNTDKKVGPLPCELVTLTGGGGSSPFDPATTKVTLEQFVFSGGYKNIVLFIDGPAIREGMGKPICYYWSDKNVIFQEKNGIYSVQIKNGKVCCGLVVKNGKAGAVIAPDESTGMRSDFRPGMTVSEVESITKQMNGTKFEKLKVEGGYTVYSLKWLQLTDDYVDLRGTTHSSIHASKEYMRFFFNASGKLVKWYQTVSNR